MVLVGSTMIIGREAQPKSIRAKNSQAVEQLFARAVLYVLRIIIIIIRMAGQRIYIFK